jgi:dTDP-4-dehydrorhamnose 3,5-epimerase
VGCILLEVHALSISDVKLIVPKRHGDARGYFVETWNRKSFREIGIDIDFCQDNLARSSQKNIVRGLHFQTPPHAQAKLVSVLEGRILDVVVDIRKSSPTFGRHLTIELSAQGGETLLVPKGFAHGYATLTEVTTVFYKVDAHYAPANDAGILWSDPDLGIRWPVTVHDAILSGKDAKLPPLAAITSPF